MLNNFVEQFLYCIFSCLHDRQNVRDAHFRRNFRCDKNKRVPLCKTPIAFSRSKKGNSVVLLNFEWIHFSVVLD